MPSLHHHATMLDEAGLRGLEAIVGRALATGNWGELNNLVQSLWAAENRRDEAERVWLDPEVLVNVLARLDMLAASALAQGLDSRRLLAMARTTSIAPRYVGKKALRRLSEGSQRLAVFLRVPLPGNVVAEGQIQSLLETLEALDRPYVEPTPPEPWDPPAEEEIRPLIGRPGRARGQRGGHQHVRRWRRPMLRRGPSAPLGTLWPGGSRRRRAPQGDLHARGAATYRARR